MSTNQTMQNTATWQIADGMTAFGSDGEKLGTVRNYDLQAGYLDIQQGWLFHKDFYVGLTTVAAVDENGVTLRLTKQDVADDRYSTPPLAGGVTYGADFAAPDRSLPEEKLPFDAEHTDLTVTRVVASEPVH